MIRSEKVLAGIKRSVPMTSLPSSARRAYLGIHEFESGEVVNRR